MLGVINCEVSFQYDGCYSLVLLKGKVPNAGTYVLGKISSIPLNSSLIFSNLKVLEIEEKDME